MMQFRVGIIFYFIFLFALILHIPYWIMFKPKWYRRWMVILFDKMWDILGIE